MEDNIDFSFILDKHGWSTFLISIKGAIHQIGISSVLSDPMYDITSLLLALLNNEDKVEMQWFEEPGWSIFRVIRDKTQRHILSVEIGNATDQYGSEYEKVVGFSIKQKQFLIIMFYQLKKSYHLLMEKSFAKDRQGEFPYDRYKKLVEKIEVTCPGIL
ncbi:hypothetical protein FHW36_10413 [Chitinophaga polysaccharea]|uniref:Uncharacterized protein n=1 Tax=Chitinophaga polysaccharea TaxID=1293035 RepID=A0A561PQJ6_9BACT|nr:hypothetical protein [Chitinophaga polysaccharea]TWF40331.1 hypothetical protein FHW36_10413 [Chitinophaga polysaccharea]